MIAMITVCLFIGGLWIIGSTAYSAGYRNGYNDGQGDQLV